MDEPKCALPRVMIAAPHGKSGKTVFVLGLLRALSQRGIEVQPFKKGPDFIDAGWHSLAAQRKSRNLDCFFMSPAQLCTVLHDAAADAQLSVIEGAMGFYDGLDLEGSSSSAEVAKLTSTPVILVIDVTRMTRTVAAIVLGCMHFDPDVNIVGVVLNRVQSTRQEKHARQSIEHFCGIPVLGALPKDECMIIPDRHLGLVSSTEAEDYHEFLDGIAQLVENHVDLDALVSLASAAPLCAGTPASLLPSDDKSLFGAAHLSNSFGGKSAFARRDLARIAIVRDSAFSFYYPENLLALEAAGAQLVYVDSLADASLPDDLDGIFIGGGFPEVFAAQLEKNVGFRTSVKEHAEEGIPLYAECGGLMYLARSIQCDGAAYQMVGALNFDVRMEEKRQAHGYSIIVARSNHPWLQAGTVLKGHEHHHSKVINRDADLPFVYENRRGRGVAELCDGVFYKGIVAGYTHINAISSPEWACGFVEKAHVYRRSRRQSSVA